MLIRNENLASSDLNIGGKVYTGDKRGVFSMPDAEAQKLLGTKGWIKTILTKRTVEALRRAARLKGLAARVAQEATDAAGVAEAALAAADRGEDDSGATTELVDEDAEFAAAKAGKVGVPKKAKAAPAPTPEPEPEPEEEDADEEPEESESEEEDADEDEDEENAVIPEGEPNMRWKQAELVAYAKEHGVEIEDTWTKSEIIEAIEGTED